MKRLHSWLMASTLTIAIHAAVAGDINAVDNIVAIVNNDVITQQELALTVNQLRSQLPKSQQIPADELQKQALDQLIKQKILIQAGQNARIEITQTDIDDALQQFAASHKLTMEQMTKQLAKEGVSIKQMRQTMANNLMVQKVQQSEVMSKGQVTDAEVDDALARAKQAGRELPPPVTSHNYHAQHILIKGDTEASRKLIAQIAQQARSGVPFEQLARQYSQDGSATNGGDLGWIVEGETVAPFEAALQSLQPGQISAPVRTQFGWHIIKLVDIKSDDSPEQRQRNGMRVALAAEKREAVVQNLLQQLQQQAFIQVRSNP
ncbi:peptidylprolyl isomerase [Neisseriaceae bacterium ESL0693]|nr:peptidylprolyl isomerase [Neisseriaceae bacterium ESL0693]